jgi:hypothetical protein
VNATGEAFVLGEHAHIVAEDPGGPRGASVLTAGERNSYSNLILLCPTHHTLVDKNDTDYPVEKLHQIKSEHELWVEATLSQRQDAQVVADELVLTDLVDSAVLLCRLEDWEIWTSWAASTDPEWPKALTESVAEFRRKVMRAVWPSRFPELRIALIHFSRTLDVAAAHFKKHAAPHEDYLLADRFYRDAVSTAIYNQKAEEFEQWLTECQELIFESTKAANWFASLVRRYINPMFLAVRGRFMLTYGPLADPPLAYKTMVLEYSDEEIAEILRKYAEAG